jgi:hypothetical protein
LRGTLATSDVAIDLEAGAKAPQLLRLRPPQRMSVDHYDGEDIQTCCWKSVMTAAG